MKKDNSKFEEEISTEEFLGMMIKWCFEFGCEFSLRNKDFDYPVMSHRANYIEIPEIIFTRGDRRISIVAHGWSDLMRRFEHEHKRIYAELGVPILERIRR